MDVALVVVPIQYYPNVSFACPTACKFVVFFSCILEMLCMFFANVFDVEIINNQCELYGSCVELPKSRYQFALPVSVFVEAFFEEFVGQESCLRVAVQAALGSDVDASIFGGLFSRDITNLDLDEFGTMKRCHEVEVGNVHCHESCPLCGDDTIEVHFGH